MTTARLQAAATGSSFILNEVGTALDNACMNCSVDRMMPALLKMIKMKEVRQLQYI